MAGSIEFVDRREHGDMLELQYLATADADDASFPTIMLGGVGGHITMICTEPGSPAPSDRWSLQLIDEHGFDYLQGCGRRRVEGLAEQRVITHANSLLHPLMHGDSELRLTDNTTNSAVVSIFLTFHSEAGF